MSAGTGTTVAVGAETALAGQLPPGAITAWGRALLAAAGDAGVPVWAMAERGPIAHPTQAQIDAAVQVAAGLMPDAARYVQGTLFCAAFELRWWPVEGVNAANQLAARYIGESPPSVAAPSGLLPMADGVSAGVNPRDDHVYLWGTRVRGNPSDSSDPGDADTVDTRGRRRFVTARIPRDLWYPVTDALEQVCVSRRRWHDPASGLTSLWRYTALGQCPEPPKESV